MRIFRDYKGFTIFFGRWFARFGWARNACFSNGSRWFSGIQQVDGLIVRMSTSPKDSYHIISTAGPLPWQKWGDRNRLLVTCACGWFFVVYSATEGREVGHRHLKLQGEDA